ncbi:MAG: transcription termination factor Rho, partial [Verrucomicrobiales bacterium]
PRRNRGRNRNGNKEGNRDGNSNRGEGNRQGGQHRDNRRDGNRENNQDAEFEDRSQKDTDLGPPAEGGGFVELSPKGFGFLRQADRNFYQTNRDTFIPPDLVRDFGLRDGMILNGEVRRGPRGPQLTAIHTINGKNPSAYQNLPSFGELTAINPNKRWILETDASRHTTRIIDMIAPIGRGQRGLIVAPPRT